MENFQKRYLLISPDFPPPNVGGSLVWLLNLVSNCPANFDVLTGKKNASYKEVLNLPNRIIRSRFIKDSHDPSRLQLISTYIYMPLWLLMYAKINKYDAVLVNPGVIGNSILFWVGKLINLKVIGAGHGEEITVPLYGKGIKNFIKRFIMRKSYKQAAGFFVVCHFCKRLLIDLEVDEKNIDVIPSCLNQEKINLDTKISKVKNKIISVGRFIERKGFHLLIDVAIELKKSIPDLTLEIVGTGPMKELLLNKISKANASDFITLHDNITDQELSFLYQKSSLFILAHMLLDNGDTEGCPTVFSEAMGHGLPIIGGTGAGADTAIIHGKNGFIVNMRNQNEMKKYISKLLQNNELQKNMVEYGKQKLEKDHNPKKNGIALFNTIERILANKSAVGDQLKFNLLDKK